MQSAVNFASVTLAILCLHCTFYVHQPGDAAPANGSGGNGAGAPTDGVTGNAPEGEWVHVTSNLVDVPSGFPNVTLVSPMPDRDKLIAGISEGGLWSSVNGGDDWQRLGTGIQSVEISNRPAAIIYDPEHSNVFWESGPYGGGVFKTTDGGVTFERLGEDLVNIDLVAIDLSDPERKTLLGNLHEARSLYRSSDGGVTWDDITDSLPSTINNCAYPLVLDANTYLLGCSAFGSVKGAIGGIIKTTDGASTWTLVSEVPADQAPLLASDGSIYWSSQFGVGMQKSTDNGDTWTSLSLVKNRTVQPVELPDGQIAAVNDENVLLSRDGGKVWRRASPKLPYPVDGLAYSTFQRAFFIRHLSAETNPPPDAISRFDFDYEE